MKLFLMEILNNQHKSSDGLPKEKKKCQRRIILVCRTEDGELEEINPNKSKWYLLYILCPNIDNAHFQRKFHDRFRLPYNSFLKLVEEAKENDLFPHWTGKDCC